VSKRSTAWNVALYAAESWSNVCKKLLEAFEMWTWRRMLKISWTEVTNNNEEVDSLRAKETWSILKTI